MSALRLEAAGRTFHSRRGGEVRALDAIDLEIQPGEYVAIEGPSGSGKSTLLLLLGGMLAPSTGRVVHDDQDVYALSASARANWRRRNIGFLFQSFHLVPYVSARENVQVPLWLGGHSADEQRTRADALLDQVGLADRADHKPLELSVGQRQRVALARVLANEPGIVLADEPTGNLDPENGERVAAFLEELPGQGRSLVVVTHDPVIASRATRRLRLIAGRLVDAT
ncbi:MAG: ABC transporter ATP-binding protein [Planctomycetota bacterium]|jgi:putative ABC transport system ATP-binding protein